MVVKVFVQLDLLPVRFFKKKNKLAVLLCFFNSLPIPWRVRSFNSWCPPLAVSVCWPSNKALRKRLAAVCE
jgi:hypothetical protein